MKRKLLAALLASLAVYAVVSAVALAQPVTAQRRPLPLGRYTCTRASDSSPLPDLKLVSGDKYESAEKTGIYVYEAGSRKIEWLTGSIPKQLLGFYVPKGTDNATSDTIIIRDKKELEEGIERDLWRCNLAE